MENATDDAVRKKVNSPPKEPKKDKKNEEERGKKVWTKKDKKNKAKDDDEDEEERGKKVLTKSKAAGSNISVMTLDIYDPYEYREEEQLGHLSNWMAWAHLVKCSFGTGVLTMPKGFAHAGLIPGLILGFGVGGFCLWCMHILIKSCVHIAARERQPYIPFNETMRYTFMHGYPACRPITKCIKGITDFVIVGYHFGICVTYVNYLAQTSLQILDEGEHAEGYNWEVAASTFAWVPFLCALNVIRNLKWLGPVSMVGNVLTFISMGIIIYYIFSPDDNGNYLSGDWHLVGKVSTIPLYIGIILFAVEAFGVIIAVERDMKQPRKFLGFCGIFNNAMFLVLGWYLFLGIVGYMRYGHEVKSTVSLTIPKSGLSSAMKIMLALSLFCSYPLHLFVCVDTIWNQRWVPSMKNPEKFGTVWYEILFRCVTIIVSAILAFAVPKLDLLVSLIGSVCLAFLGIMMPGIMEYNVAWSKYGNQWSLTMVKDIVIAVLGGCAFVIGTYGALYGMFQPESEG